MDNGRAPAGPPAGMSMIVSDLDGTLLDGLGRISRRTVDAVAELKHAGVHFIIATARPLRDILEIARTLSLEGPIICQNGAVIAFRPQRGSDLKSWLMDTALQRELVEATRARFPGCSIAVDYPHHRLADPQWPGPYGRGPVHQPLWPLHGPELPRQRAACIMIRDAWDDPAELEERFRVTATTSASGLLEVSKKGVDKAWAMLRICKMFEISPDDVVAFGDMPNDLSMLASSGTGIAVSNAPPSVRATADRVAKSNDEDGVAEMIELLLQRTPD
jgi:hydroxymethylpyrimidine pyrophosphatase-like HAD family hydrolase